MAMRACMDYMPGHGMESLSPLKGPPQTSFIYQNSKHAENSEILPPPDKSTWASVWRCF